MGKKAKTQTIDISMTWEQYVYAMLTTWEQLSPEGKDLAMQGMRAMARKLDTYEKDAA